MNLLLAQCPRCLWGRLARDEDPDAGVEFTRCLSCGMNQDYVVRDVFRMETCEVFLCERDELHGRELVEV